MTDPERLLLLVRSGCHLCDEARAALLPIARERGLRLAERDVDADEDLRRRWSDLVPVLFVDGREVAYWRVDPVRVAAEIDGG
jgi:glutaredoxin